jgi:hypothetical protein
MHKGIVAVGRELTYPTEGVKVRQEVTQATFACPLKQDVRWSWG